MPNVIKLRGLASTVLAGAVMQGILINKLYNARIAKVCMVCSLDTVPKNSKEDVPHTALHDFYTIISLS